MSAVGPHEIVLAYTTDDDGIWLECRDCKWRGQVPGNEFWPTVEQVMTLARGHWAFQ
jgi:hypothetical protein